jgi:hypothetical protein
VVVPQAQEANGDGAGGNRVDGRVADTGKRDAGGNQEGGARQETLASQALRATIQSVSAP